MSESEVINNPERREFLGKVTAAVGGAGVAAACWPFVSSMNPSVDVLAKGKTEVDLAGVRPGEMHTVLWQGKPVFILHRSDDQIKNMQSSQGGFDPEDDQKRVKQAEWLVVLGVCTHMGCVPAHNADGWACPCHGSLFDNSGRVLRGPAPRNLDVPPYKFVSADKILIGET